MQISSVSNLTQMTPDDRLSVMNIQRTCVHDGPGIRTTVFFQGCNMRCEWCQNPESHDFTGNRDRPHGSSIEEILAVVRRDRRFYDLTGGGVTLSGGEAMMQHGPSLARLVRALKADGIHVAIETAGDAPWKNFQAVLADVDLFLFDLKYVADGSEHQRLVGRPFKPVMENLARLVTAGARIEFRMCVVPGRNDSDTNIRATAELLRSLGYGSITLLRYFDMHESKARRLGIARSPLGITVDQARQALARAARTFIDLGLKVDVHDPDEPRRETVFSDRVNTLRRDIRDAGYSLCMESAFLKTRFYRRHGFKGPVNVKRANLLRYILNNKKVIVYPHELLVGNFTAKRVGAQLWLEYFSAGGIGNIWNCDKQTPVAFKCGDLDKARYYAELAPFWTRNSVITKIFPNLTELGLFAARMLEKKVGFENNMSGVSHFIVNNERLLRLGTEGIRAEVLAARQAKRDAALLDFPKKDRSDDFENFYEAVLTSLTALEEFAARYARHLKKMARDESDPTRAAELRQMAEVCEHVPKHPARTFHEALQSILFMLIGLCMEAFENAISFGRLDQILYPFLRADLDAGRITMERARELVACLVLKCDESIFFNDGDTGFELGKMFETLSPVYTITMGGTDTQGNDATNDVTYMILDACKLHPLSVNMAARIHAGSPDAYLRRIAEVYVTGTPMPELFNDDVYVPALRHNYPDTTIAQSRNYSIVGCVEPCASTEHFGNTDSANVNLTMPLLQALTGDTTRLWRYGGLRGIERRGLDFAAKRLATGPLTARMVDHVADRLSSPTCVNPPASMDELLDRFQDRLNEVTADVLADQYLIETALAKTLPVPLASATFESAVTAGRDLLQGGAAINTSGIQAVGVTDVADSLYAIDELVFKRGAFTMQQLLDALDANFQGPKHERIREMLMAIPKFGNDADPRPAQWETRVMEAWCKALAAVPKTTRGGRYVAGYYGLNVNLAYGRNTPALPSGRLAGVPLANSVVPHYGMKMVDLTGSLNAVAQVDFPNNAPNGTTNTATIDAALFPGDGGIDNLAGMIRAYFDQGGMQFQPNVFSRETLLDAYKHPEKYPNLLIRIAGYCAYFNDLSDDLKLEIINRTYYSDAV
ncbi:MAG TPA: pyruvate formate lyase family protein [Myxococcota bacterium]|nr:pyruvate formate lyase family protein [Myxococcota bacterium]